jgi:hypothetical protein
MVEQGGELKSLWRSNEGRHIQQAGVMPRWPEKAEGMERSKRARKRKLDTAKTDLKPPLAVLRRAGCPSSEKYLGHLPQEPHSAPVSGRSNPQSSPQRCGSFAAHSFPPRSELIQKLAVGTLACIASISPRHKGSFPPTWWQGRAES